MSGAHSEAVRMQSDAETLHSEATTVPENNAVNDTTAKKKRRFIDRLYDIVKDFSRVDTNYVEPMHYNFQAMVQNINTYETYTLRGKSGQKISLAPEPTYRVGPYIGWRWIFLGYTLDLKNMSFEKQKKEFDLSLYSAQVGIDIYYRQTGNDYKIRELDLGSGNDAVQIKNVPFSGFEASIKGFDLYYIFNHKRFSYPAAFNQSTTQRRSCGSPLVGIGYTKQRLNLDGQALMDVVEQKSPSSSQLIDTTFVGAKVDYTDFSVSAGYAYNYVFARNWLLAASIALDAAYKKSAGEQLKTRFSLKEFSFSNFNIDATSRFGIVWTDTKYFAGASAIFHAYNYHKSRFSTNSVFGNVKIYAGFNFGLKKHHQKYGKKK